jgi:acylphosphatase
MRHVHVTVLGRVQGVGYRMATERQAQLRGLMGWVRNARDGSVEACIEGDASQVAAMLNWLQDGPALARVSSVDVTRDERIDAPSHTGFEVRY